MASQQPKAVNSDVDAILLLHKLYNEAYDGEGRFREMSAPEIKVASSLLSRVMYHVERESQYSLMPKSSRL